MTAMFILVPIALAMGLLGLLGFVWAVRKGQFEDLEGDARRILLPDYDDKPL